jgi:excisionase family DNA binding protein
MKDTLADTIEKSNHALTASELAELLSVNKLTIYRQAQAGGLPHFRLGTCVRFDPRAIAAWLRERGAL